MGNENLKQKTEEERMAETFLEDAEVIEDLAESASADGAEDVTTDGTEQAAPEPAKGRQVVCHLKEHYGVLSYENDGWCKELNLVSWNNGPEKLDIRSWDHLHRRKSRGITLRPEEAETLYRLLERLYGSKDRAEA